MSPEADKSGDNERTRLCPTCRMSISVLATKCRFCGESVGRPQEATRSLSVSDLGGETVRHYAPSSNVMDALETFRSEETTTQTPIEHKKEKTLFGLRAKKPEGDGKPQQSAFGLPELDARSQDLAQVSIGTSAVRKAVKKQTPPWVNWIKTGIKGVLALAILYGFIAYGVPAIQQALKKEEVKSNIVNEAPRLIAQGADPLLVLKKALYAYKFDSSTENARIAAEAREIVKKRVNSVLSESKFSRPNLIAAQKLAHEASIADTHQDMMQLKRETDEEMRAYSLLYLGAVEEGGTKSAKFQVQAGPNKHEIVTVPQDGTLDKDRFKVANFSATSCRLTDTLRKRSVVCVPNRPIE